MRRFTAMNRPSPSRFPGYSRSSLGAESTKSPSDPRTLGLPAGSRLAEYKILSVLGQGASGFTYLAMDHGLQRHVVIEEYFPAALARRGNGPAVILSSDEHAEAFAHGLDSFIDQARLLAQFDHPSLMRVYRFWEANRTAYLATPCYEGTTLGVARQAMERPPDENWLRELLLPLLDALEILHEASCYDWDITPGNILLLPDGRPVLLNYAALRSDRPDPAFAPIERYAQSAALQLGPWTSLYSLAALTYFCVGGEPPVDSTVRALDDRMEPLFEVVDRLGRSHPDLNYSVAFVSAIERALNVRPEERPPALAEFRRALLGGRSAAESILIRPLDRNPAGQEAAAPASSSWSKSSSPPPVTDPREEPRGHPRYAGEPEGVEPETAQFPDIDELRGALQAEQDGALDPRLFAEPGRRSRADGGQRMWFAGFAALALVVVGATGWILWSDYREAQADLRFLALTTEAPPPAGLPSVQPPPETPEPSIEGAAAGSSPLSPEPPSTASILARPETAPDDPPVANGTARAEAPARDSAPAAQSTERAASPTRRVRNETGNPRALCGTRTQFSLYRCMKDVCESPKYYEHAECKHLRVMDEVREYP